MWEAYKQQWMNTTTRCEYVLTVQNWTNWTSTKAGQKIGETLRLMAFTFLGPSTVSHFLEYLICCMLTQYPELIADRVTESAGVGASLNLVVLQ